MISGIDLIRRAIALLHQKLRWNASLAHSDADSENATQSQTDPLTLEQTTPEDVGVEERIAMAARCEDWKMLPRVRGAGQIRVLRDRRRVQVMHNGLQVAADGYYGDWMTRLIEACGGCHEPQEELVFQEIMRRLPNNASMIELGGYWAFYSLWFLSLCKDRRSIVIEPDPKHLEVGRLNAALNHLDMMFIQGCAGETSVSDIRFKTEKSGDVRIARYSVPDLMEAHEIEQLDVLHCDIQGAEFRVLKSCEELFRAQRIQFLFVSTHDFRISGDPLIHQRCLAVVLNCGGVVIAEHDVHESYSGDGLIVAYFGNKKENAAPVRISRNRYSQSLFRNPLYDLALARRKRNRCRSCAFTAALASVRVTPGLC
jgi:FkbM family methyltransferase